MHTGGIFDLQAIAKAIALLQQHLLQDIRTLLSRLAIATRLHVTILGRALVRHAYGRNHRCVTLRWLCVFTYIF